MPCLVRSGGRTDAIKAGIGDNLSHRGERLTRADKRRAVTLLLDALPKETKSREIARIAGVSHTFVDNIKGERETRSGNVAKTDGRVTSGGIYGPPEKAPLVSQPADGPASPPDDDDFLSAPAIGQPAERVDDQTHGSSPTESQAQRPPRPSRKPIKETFDEAQRQLAKVSQLLDTARGATKRETNYVDCMNKLKSLSDAIEVWSNKSA